MSKPQARNASKKKQNKKAALSPLFRAMRGIFDGARPTKVSKPALTKPKRSMERSPAIAPSAIRFEALEPRVLLSGDVNPAVLAINGDIAVPGEQDHIAFTLEQPTRVVFDSLTNRSDLSWQLDGPSGQVAHQSKMVNKEASALEQAVQAVQLKNDFMVTARNAMDDANAASLAGHDHSDKNL